jgi:hypothetical protein
MRFEVRGSGKPGFAKAHIYDQDFDVEVTVSDIGGLIQQLREVDLEYNLGLT